jgi:anti-sigma B factor antagonist
VADQPTLLVEIARTGPVALVRVTGEVDLETAFVLRAALRKLTAEPMPPRRIAVDLEHVTFLDAAGLDILVQARQRAHRAGADLVVCNAHGIVRRVFDVTGLAASFGMAG